LLKRPPNQDFERQMLPHLDAAYNFARWLLRHAEDAEDAVQDAFLRAYQVDDHRPQRLSDPVEASSPAAQGGDAG